MANIAVVVPCYNGKAQFGSVLEAMPPCVARIFVVDDCCPEKTGEFVRAKLKDSRIRILTHEKNQGVGGAVMTGYKAAIAEGKRPFSTNPSILFKMKNYSQKEIKKVVSIDKTHMKGP